MWSSLLDCAYTDDSCERARLKLLRLVADGEIGRDTAVAQMQAVIDRLSEHADEAALELVRQQVASASSAGRRR